MTLELLAHGDEMAQTLTINADSWTAFLVFYGRDSVEWLGCHRKFMERGFNSSIGGPHRHSS